MEASDKIIILGDVISLELNLQTIREGEFYLRKSESLDLIAQGYTKEEAEINFRDVLQIFIEEHQKNGTFLEVLKDLGWYIDDDDTANAWIPESFVIADQQFRMEIPVAA
jgi:predicted RNase H-like HicB family nuclease